MQFKSNYYKTQFKHKNKIKQEKYNHNFLFLVHVLQQPKLENQITMKLLKFQL